MFSRKLMISQRKLRLISIVSLFSVVVAFSIMPANYSHARTNQAVSDFSRVQTLAQAPILAQATTIEDNLQSEQTAETVEEAAALTNEEPRVQIPWFFQSTVVFTFIWLLVGVSVNYGYRMYWNSPIHPSFIPFVFVTVAAIIAFSVVIAFNISIGGEIEFEIIGQKFSGASGPAILWVLTFLAIMAGFRMTGASKLASSETKSNPPSHHLLKEKQ